MTLTRMEQTLADYNAKRAAKEQAQRELAESNRVPVLTKTCRQCQAPCTGSIQSFGAPLCSDCFTKRLDDQSRGNR